MLVTVDYKGDKDRVSCSQKSSNVIGQTCTRLKDDDAHSEWNTHILVFVLIGFAKVIFNLCWREFEREPLSLPTALIPEVNPTDLKSLRIWEFSPCHRNLGRKKV